LNLGYFGVFLFVCFVFCFFSPWWDNNTSETPSPGLQAEGLAPKLLRLKLYCIWTWRFFFIFCLCNACLAYCWLVHYLSQFISLALFFFVVVCLFCFLFVCFSLFLYLLCFPSPLTLPF
jgi:hypothetical protein